MTTAEREGARRAARRKAAVDWRRDLNGGRLTRGRLRLSSGGARFALFSYKYLRHTKGRAAGTPLALEPWQLEIVSELLERERDFYVTLEATDLFVPERWVRKVEEFLYDLDEFESPRIHREALIGLPKKNGKSTLSGGLALYLLMADGEPGAEVYSAAAAKDQAGIVFRQAKAMVLASEILSSKLRIYRDRIEHPETDSFYAVISADADVQEGVNPHAVIADELHAHKSRALYDTLRSATIGREEPLFVSITTAGVDLETICGEVFTRGAGPRPRYRLGAIVPRADKARSFYFHWRGVPEAKRGDRVAWKQANPLRSLTLERLEEEAAIERPRAIFERYHLNAWTRIDAHVFTPTMIEKLVDRKLTIARGAEIVVAVDVGLMHDTFGVTWNTAGEPPFVLRGQAWGAWPDPKKPPPPAHEIVEGPGPLDFDVVEAFILDDLARTYRIREVTYDPYKFARSAEILKSKGLRCIEFDQGHSRMVPASEGLYRKIAKREVRTAKDLVLQAHLEAAAARDVGSGRWRLDKGRAKRPMDLAVCAAMGLERASAPAPPKPGFAVL